MTSRRPLISVTLSAAALLGCAGLGQGAILTWQSIHQGNPLDYLYEPYGSGDSSYDLSYANTWDITLSGFSPGVHGIDGIQVWFAFADDRPGADPQKERQNGNGGDAEEYVDISLGGTRIWDDLEVDGVHPSSSFAYYSMMLDPVLHASIFSDLAVDGKLGYRVELQQMLSDSGSESKYGEDTYLKVAKVKAWYDDTPPENVPEGGVGWGLLALSLGGMIRWRRRLG